MLYVRVCITINSTCAGMATTTTTPSTKGGVAAMELECYETAEECGIDLEPTLPREERRCLYDDPSYPRAGGGVVNAFVPDPACSTPIPEREREVWSHYNTGPTTPFSSPRVMHKWTFVDETGTYQAGPTTATLTCEQASSRAACGSAHTSCQPPSCGSRRT